jgi:hypothetical protein
MKQLSIVAVAASLLGAASAQALTVDIVLNATRTAATVSLSGEATTSSAVFISASRGVLFSDLTDEPIDDLITGGGDFAVDEDSGDATVTVGGTDYDVIQYRFDDDSDAGVGNDDFNVRFGTDLTIPAGTLISFSGSSLITLPTGLGLNLGSYEPTEQRLGGALRDAMVNISIVPVPPALPLLAFGIGAIAMVRRVRG